MIGYIEGQVRKNEVREYKCLVAGLIRRMLYCECNNVGGSLIFRCYLAWI